VAWVGLLGATLLNILSPRLPRFLGHLNRLSPMYGFNSDTFILLYLLTYFYFFIFPFHSRILIWEWVFVCPLIVCVEIDCWDYCGNDNWWSALSWYEPKMTCSGKWLYGERFQMSEGEKTQEVRRMRQRGLRILNRRHIVCFWIFGEILTKCAKSTKSVP